ncbi:uncharacterized protein PAC_20076 [Phialocephala subalpina]|uniref:Uncharacterized protein n=1 Tax=Phialocephala subalpina TaxID=576137 RepID=A0A1L7XYZ4_9HELO|nr:uncharacterized protein PAC_20076 [Phialocephala subalpina]
MVVNATIVVAVISLVSALAAAAFTGWWSYYSAERTRLIDAQTLVDKYSDPILLAAQDLQERLFRILVDKPGSKSQGPASSQAGPSTSYPLQPSDERDRDALHPSRDSIPRNERDRDSTHQSRDSTPSGERDRDALHPSRDSILRNERDRDSTHQSRDSTPSNERYQIHPIRPENPDPAMKDNWDPHYPLPPLRSQSQAVYPPQSQPMQTHADPDNLLLYTAFLVGQYFSWTSIMRRQAQFLKFSTSTKNKDLVSAFQKINDAFTPFEEADDPLSKPFSLPRSYQGAIGEMMTKDYDGDKPVCKGYATFHALWRRGELYTYPPVQSDDVTKHFQMFFHPIVDGINAVYAAKREGKPPPDRRLRRLQHLFVDLVNLLDDKHMRFRPVYCPLYASCTCTNCSEKRARQARRARRGKNQEVGPPPFHSQTHDLEAAADHGEQQNEMHLVAPVEAGKLQEQQQAEEESGASDLGDPASSYRQFGSRIPIQGKNGKEVARTVDRSVGTYSDSVSGNKGDSYHPAGGNVSLRRLSPEALIEQRRAHELQQREHRERERRDRQRRYGERDARDDTERQYI